jgi:hypothetical protein
MSREDLRQIIFAMVLAYDNLLEGNELIIKIKHPF